jgi:16S rRNA (cytidine1402-2'-O)-methyltransferase
LNEGTLFVVATPIGNLDDLSPRARAVLAAVDLVAAEDTRVTGRLLSHFGIKKRQIPLHEHNEESASAGLVRELQEGKSIALVSDAGTPLISDPGFDLLRRAHAAGITVSPIAGPSAVVAALSASGLPTDRFAFEGFLPARKSARTRRLQSLAAEKRTLVFYESVHRIAETVDDMAATLGAGRMAFIGRELSKWHEQCVSADLQSLANRLDDGSIPLKGEFVIVVSGAGDAEESAGLNAELLLAELVGVLPGKQAVEIVARVGGGSRNELYQRMLALKADDSVEK